jgi:aldehyde:ferredoxin oxidoreductase
METSIEEPDDGFYRRYLGGNGFVAYYLLKEVPKGANPLGPRNVLVFAGGPITGVTVAGAGRNAVGAKSPLTGGYGEADVGGFFGAELKRAGFDAIVIKGKAANPVYLWINKGEAEIRSAEHLWGMETFDCQEAVRKELGEKSIRIAAIGPAGENLVRFACIMNDLKHAAGRTGLGAVMGSKKLKCIAAKGRGAVSVADKERVKGLATYMRENWREHSERMHELGTPGGVPDLNELGALPTRNFQDGQFEGYEKISGQTMKDTILVGTDSCFACPVRCKRVVDVSGDGYEVAKKYGGPEYETMAAFGSNCGIDDLHAVAKANEICNAQGMDTITAGMMVSFAMECYENGLISRKAAGGLDLKFGNASAMVTLVEQMATRQGLGKTLADGLEKSVKRFGPETAKYTVAVKGQPFPMHECRVRHGQGLGYAVSPTGADHMHNIWENSMADDPVGEAWRSIGVYEPVPMTELNATKVRAYTTRANWQWAVNCLGMCMFIGWSKHQLVDLLEGITGWETNVWELIRTGERSVTMARIFNMREGMTRKDDILPERIMTQSHKSGTVNEKPISSAELDGALTRFYSLMGWDPDSGRPLEGTLEELDVAWAKGIV